MTVEALRGRKVASGFRRGFVLRAAINLINATLSEGHIYVNI